MKAKNFTTTLSPDLLRSLDSVAKETKKSKSDILSEAFRDWIRKRNQKIVAESYKKASDDPEWRSLSEEGLDDFLKQINLWEK